MKKIDILDVNGKKVSDITLNKDVFGIEPNDTVLYDAIKLSQNSTRQGTASVKGRSDVSGGGRKPWRQKGTGRARQGSIRAPHWYHGAVAFGQQFKNYTTKMNRKERRLALKSALYYKLKYKELIVLDNLDIKSNKTKDMKNILNNLKAERNVLIVVNELTDDIILSTRNLDYVLLLEASEINTLDVVSADVLIVTKDAVKTIEEALA